MCLCWSRCFSLISYNVTSLLLPNRRIMEWQHNINNKNKKQSSYASNGEQKCYQFGFGFSFALLATCNDSLQLNCARICFISSTECWCMCACIPPPLVRSQNSKTESSQNVICKICFCFSHWVFNVYCILNCFLLLLFILFSHSFAHPHTNIHMHFISRKQTVMVMMITLRFGDTSHVCVAVTSTLFASQLQLQLRATPDFWFVIHICQFIFILCWRVFSYTTVPMLGSSKFASNIVQFLTPFNCANISALFLKWRKYSDEFQKFYDDFQKESHNDNHVHTKKLVPNLLSYFNQRSFNLFVLIQRFV